MVHRNDELIITSELTSSDIVRFETTNTSSEIYITYMYHDVYLALAGLHPNMALGIDAIGPQSFYCAFVLYIVYTNPSSFQFMFVSHKYFY